MPTSRTRSGKESSPLAKARGAPIYEFGTPEEIANRDNTGNWTAPQHNVPSFSQIRPARTGKDLNSPGMDSKSGNMKFSGGV